MALILAVTAFVSAICAGGVFVWTWHLHRQKKNLKKEQLRILLARVEIAGFTAGFLLVVAAGYSLSAFNLWH